MYITEEQLLPGKNNFSLLRLIAALFVFLTHSCAIRGLWKKELIDQLSGGRYTFSSLGMIIFFTMSGFLVCKSILTTTSIAQYAINRFLRIWPAFAVCTILTILIPGLIFTTLPPLDFLTHHQTLFFLFKNLSLTGTSFWLPGVFNNNSINASIWSIPVEVRLYLLLLLVFLINRNRLKQLLLFILAVLIIIQILFSAKSLIPIVGSTNYGTITLGTFFVIGATFYLYRSVIPFRWVIWLALFIPWLVCYLWLRRYSLIIDYFFFSYSFLGIVFFMPVVPFWKTDISYGFYLYASPIQKIIQAVWGMQFNFISYTVVCALCITIVASLSWFIIEKRALQWKYALKL